MSQYGKFSKLSVIIFSFCSFFQGQFLQTGVQFTFAAMTADTENKSLHCLLCNSRVGVSTRNSCPIFQQNVTSSERTVAATIGIVLNQELSQETVHSDVVSKFYIKSGFLNCNFPTLNYLFVFRYVKSALNF